MFRIKRQAQKPLFTSGTAVNVRAAVCVLISVVAMTVDHRRSELDPLRDMLATAVYPLQYLVTVPFDAARWVSEGLASRRRLLEENRSLREKQVYISAQLQRLTSLEAENRRLRLLLESSARVPERMLIAELLTVDSDPYRHQILLNRGSRHGIASGQPLLDQRGIVGQVIHANTLSATAILITDPNHALPVQVNRSGLRTLAVGTGRFGELKLPYVPNNADLRAGDLLVTSGLGGRFPRGYPVARVSSVDGDAGSPFARVTAAPMAQLDRIREVLSIVGGEPRDDPAARARR